MLVTLTMLLTSSLRNRLRANAEQSATRDRDHLPLVKLFTPDANATWLFSELMSDGDTLYGLCDLGHGCPELGYASLADPRCADPLKLRAAYNDAYPPEDDGSQGKTLFQYLAMDANLAQHSIVRFASLERRTDEENKESIHAAAIEPEEGKRLLKHLVRVEFVDAQRNINDDDSSRSNRLSSAFAAFYRKNLCAWKGPLLARGVPDERKHIMSKDLPQLLNSVARLIEARSGTLGKYALTERLELWVNPHASGIQVLYVDSSSGEELAEKTYVHGKRALGAIRTKLVKLGISSGEVSAAADVSGSGHCEGSNDNRRQVVEDRAPLESRWRKVPVAFVQQTSRSRAGCEVVGEVGELPEGGFEAKVKFEGRTRTWEFDTEWEAKNFVLIKLNHLLEWASAA